MINVKHNKFTNLYHIYYITQNKEFSTRVIVDWQKNTETSWSSAQY